MNFFLFKYPKCNFPPSPLSTYLTTVHLLQNRHHQSDGIRICWTFISLIWGNLYFLIARNSRKLFVEIATNYALRCILEGSRYEIIAIISYYNYIITELSNTRTSKDVCIFCFFWLILFVFVFWGIAHKQWELQFRCNV